MKSRDVSAVGVCFAALASACGGSPTIVDNAEPPSGYTAIVGSLKTSAGFPVSGAEISFNRCASPVSGYLGAAITNSTGEFALEAPLAAPRLDSAYVESLRVLCLVAVDRGQALDSLFVRFRKTKGDIPLQRVDLKLP